MAIIKALQSKSTSCTSESILYLVPTPIGNLADMTYRGVQVLRDVDVIYSEDTRTSGILLKHYEIKTPQRSYHRFNERERCEEIINLLKKGKNIAIISDAGTPGISDPSNIIVKEVLKHTTDLSNFSHDIKICPLPGATALIPALVASGFDTERFFMIGFLPTKKKERDHLLNTLKNFLTAKPSPLLVFYEGPHRLFKTLSELKNVFLNPDICIAREISKIYETFYRGKLDDILHNIDKITLKGEFVIVIKKTSFLDIDQGIKSLNEAILNLYHTKYRDEKLTKACKYIAEELSVKRNDVYDVLIKNRYT